MYTTAATQQVRRSRTAAAAGRPLQIYSEEVPEYELLPDEYFSHQPGGSARFCLAHGGALLIDWFRQAAPISTSTLRSYTYEGQRMLPLRQ